MSSESKLMTKDLAKIKFLTSLLWQFSGLLGQLCDKVGDGMSDANFANHEASRD